jgi:hypothetical protein
MIWNNRPRLIKQGEQYVTGTVIVVSESLPSAINMITNSKLSGLPVDLVSKEIANLPDINAQVLSKDIGMWAFPSHDTEDV